MKGPSSEVDQHDIRQATNFWTGEWISADPKVKSSSLADVMSTLHALNSGRVRMLLSEGTNLSPQAMDRGKFVLVNMPVHSTGANGLAVMAAWKYSVERYVLRRMAQENTPPLVIWSDEFQNVASSFDSTYIAECRKHHGCLGALTQSIHSFHTAMRDDHHGHQTKALLANFAFKIVHALADSESAVFCSQLCGRDKELLVQGRPDQQAQLHNVLMGMGGLSSSFGEHYADQLQPRLLLSGLRTGGPPDYVCDAVCIRSGEPLANGKNFKFVTFSQR
jgi:type IV secretory pathway TraG/TraD family ATPase VirD4